MELIGILYFWLVCLVVVEAVYIPIKRNKRNLKMESAPIINTIRSRDDFPDLAYPTEEIEKALSTHKEFLPLLNQTTPASVRTKRDIRTSQQNGECNSHVYREEPVMIKTSDGMDYIVINHGPYYQLVVTEKCIMGTYKTKICGGGDFIVEKSVYKGSCEQQHQQIYLLTYNSTIKAIERSVFRYNSSCVCKLKPKFDS